MNRKLHSKLIEEKILKEKILHEQNADNKEFQFGLVSKDGSSSNMKENTSPASGQSNCSMDAEDSEHESKEFNSSDVAGDERKEPSIDPTTTTTSPPHEKVNKGCQCGPNDTSWISNEDLKLVMQSLNRHQSNLLSACLHPIEDIPAAAVTQVPVQTTTHRTKSSKKSKMSKSNFNVNDVD
ncbi:hypothetical protein FHG87_000339 [Trinorchestia longiramus]|nr:hypothetical protein FHG87_000339 [Trinorchestia longiramus]